MWIVISRIAKRLLKTDSFLFSWCMISLTEISIFVQPFRKPICSIMWLLLEASPFLQFRPLLNSFHDISLLRWNSEKLLICIRDKPGIPGKHVWLQIRILSLSTPRASWGKRRAGKIVFGLPILGDLSFQGKWGIPVLDAEVQWQGNESYN